MSANRIPDFDLQHLPRSTATNFYLSVQDAQKVWIVRAGKVDIFLQEKGHDGHVGARLHLVRLQKDQIMFGLRPQTRSGAVLLASLHPGTVISYMSLADFRTTREFSSILPRVPLLYGWIHKLYSAVSEVIAPKEHKTINPGDELFTGDEPAVVVPGAEIVWVTHARGSSHFCGTDVVVSGQRYLPLSREGSGWLQVAEKSSILCADFNEVQSEDPEWQWLEHLHEVILDSLLYLSKRRDAEERERIKTQKDSDVALAHRTLLHLASPLVGGEAAVIEEGITKDPLLIACRAIGARMGIHFRASAEKNVAVSHRYAVEVIAKASNTRSRRVLLRGEWWKQGAGPLLGFMKDDDRPVALLPTGETGYEAYDALKNRTTQIDHSSASQLNSFAYSFYRPFPTAKLKGRDLLLFGVSLSKRELLMTLLMGVAGGILGMVFPIATGIVFDRIIPGADRRQLFQITALLLTSAVAAAFFTLVRSFAVLRLEARVDSSLQAAMWDRVLRLPARFFRDFSSGDLAVRSLAMSQIRQILTGSTLSSMLSGIFSVFSLGLLFYYSWPLALVASALALFALLVSGASAYVQLRYARRLARVRGAIASMLLQFVNGVTKLRVSGTENRAFSAWAFAFSEQKRLYMTIRQLANRLTVFNSIFPVVALAIIFWAAGGLVGRPGFAGISTGAFLAFLAAFIQFLAAMLQLTSSAVSILGIVPIYERAKPILQALPEVDEGKAHPGEVQGAVEVNHLSFRYSPDSPLVLRDISFSICAREFVAFTGPSGSGKSTLLRLLLGFEQLESGTIAYDGQDIGGVDLQALRQQIGVVLQSGRLISGTVFDNIVGSLPLTHDDAWEAARMAGLDRDIKAMPMGMHTFVSEGGGGFSGGQRQRLMIARAIVNKPRVLFFDEATSALDNQTQAIVSRSLETLRATRIVIAHRLSTIINADEIFVFERGAIVQRGSYAQLLHEPGLFQELVQRQTL